MKIIKSIPKENIYFNSEEIVDGNIPENTECGILNIFDEFEYQEMIGFGGAFTESSAYLYSLLTDVQKKDFMEKYFDKEKGIGYNFGRTHIGSCDFSLDIYSCVEEGDLTLDTFNIEREKKYIIPFIKDALKYSNEPIMLFASPWTPPSYMKDNNSPTHGGKIKDEFKCLWAKFYVEFINAFKAEGIKISAITVQNEPCALQPWESCLYSPEDESEFVEKHLIKALDEAGMYDIKIIIWDHNKERVYDRAKRVFASETVRERTWGVGHHWYSGDHFDGMRLVYEKYGKVLISTENCGLIYEDPHELAERYGKELFGDINNFTAAYCDWNLLLSEKGGPFHNRNDKTTATSGIIYEDKSAGCFAPVLYDTENRELVYTPVYYYIGHFSKFVQRGAIRIATTKYSEDIYACAFKNTDGSIVSVVMNASDIAMPVNIRYNDEITGFMLEPHAISTVIL